MNSIVYVGMDVHKESYTVCCYNFDTDEVLYKQKISADYKLILKYLEQLRKRFADDGSGPSCSMGENVDSTSVGLPGSQEELVKAVFDVQKNIVVVHMDGRPLSSVWIANNIPAIIEAWHPGQCGAKAVADVLAGKYNPGGKLPMTAVRDSGQMPIYLDQLRGSGMTEKGMTNSNIDKGYVNQTGKPLYYFGHGLSYTKFTLDKID